MKNIRFMLAICTVLALPALAMASGSEDVAKRTMLNTGNYLVQCQDGSVEGEVTPFDYFAGNVCPSKKKTDVPIKRFLGIMTLGSCSTNSVNTDKGFEVEFAEPYLNLSHSKDKTSANCLMVLKYQLPAGFKITYSKVRVEFDKSKVSGESDVRVEMSADGGAKIKKKIEPMSGKATIDYSFDKPSSTPCYKEPGSTTRINLHTAMFGDKLSEKDDVTIVSVSVPDFKVVKCAD